MRPSKTSKPTPVTPIFVPLTPQEAYEPTASNHDCNHLEIDASSTHDQPDAPVSESGIDDPNTPLINALPDELLLKVFERLTLRARINAELGNTFIYHLF